MARTPITDEVLEQLRAVRDSDRVEDMQNRYGVQSVALQEGYEALSGFILEADAVRYTHAIELLERGDE